MELHRIGIKVPLLEGMALPALDFIQVFHRWIQDRALDGVLVDVADYSHVHEGPGILLITHAGNYAVDDHDGRRGLSYYAKHALAGDLGARIATVARHALTACNLLEQEARFAGGLKFDAGRLELFANDRLEAPNTPETEAALAPVVQGLLKRLYPGKACRIERETEPRARFTLRIDSGRAATAADILSRL